jgi:hypothetical protein
MKYSAFKRQAEFHRSKARYRAALAGKRGGKTEAGAIEAIIHTEEKIGYRPSQVDPYIGAVIAPTSDMLRRLSLKKLLGYAQPFSPEYHKTHQEITWHNGALIYGISADKPARLEGIKANWIWIDEALQVSEQLFLEAIARVSDTEGRIWCTGSLGVQWTNPKNHWIHKYFKERPLEGSDCFEWSTAENPHFPRMELERLRNNLDPKTYRQMFEVDWNVPGSALVYDDFDQANLTRSYVYNPSFETIVAIDWGWAHELACLFFQYDRINDVVYLFDEIVGSKITLDQLWERIKAKPYKISEWICDIAGNQEREQTGLSNVQWFKQSPRNISFKYRSSAINYGIPIVRTYIKNGLGQRKFIIDEGRCPKSLDGVRNYSYPEKEGIIVNDLPLKKNDDAVDAIRYFFVNKLDYNKPKDTFVEFNRWRL